MKKLFASDFEAICVGWTNFHDPDPFAYTIWHSSQWKGRNFAHYKNPRVDEALAKVEEALRIDPSYIHAHWDRTQYLFHGKRDFAGAVKAGEAFLKVVPDGPDADNVRRLIAEARQNTGSR